MCALFVCTFLNRLVEGFEKNSSQFSKSCQVSKQLHITDKLRTDISAVTSQHEGLILVLGLFCVPSLHVPRVYLGSHQGLRLPPYIGKCMKAET